MEAYNHDRVTGMAAQPAGGMNTGQQGFTWAYYTAQPADAEESGGVPTGVWIAVAAVRRRHRRGRRGLVMRRKKTADERE